MTVYEQEGMRSKAGHGTESQDARLPQWKCLQSPEGLFCDGERETLALGVHIGTWMKHQHAEAPVLLLEGEMGAGKTVLVRGIAQGLGLDSAAVQSPTFTLVNEYSDCKGNVRLVHCDLYRLQPEEVESTGILDLVAEGEVAVVVEWAERLPVQVPQASRLRLSRTSGTDGNRRLIEGIALAEGAFGG